MVSTLRSLALAARPSSTVETVRGGRLLGSSYSHRDGRTDGVREKVVAGPTEAAALGNVLVQARALGEALPDLAAMRALVRRTQDLTQYEPGTTSGWDAAEERLRSNPGS